MNLNNEQIEHLVDKPLVTIAWLTTIFFVLFVGFLSVKVRQSKNETIFFHLYINILFIICVVIGFFIFQVTIKSDSMQDTLFLLWRRIFNGKIERLCLLLFWAICTTASIIFCVSVNLFCERSTTIHRKFFHLTVSLVAITGLLYDIKLLYIAANFIFLLFVIIEVLRSFEVDPWAQTFNQWLLFFIDEVQESSRFIVTPILLYVGVFLPILLGNFNAESNWIMLGNNTVLKQRFFCGVQTVGIGDSFAAIVGTWFGKNSVKWTQFSSVAPDRKSFIGSLAMFISQLLIMPLIYYFCSFSFSYFALLLTALISTILEAHLNTGDNLILSIVSFIVYYLLE